MRTVKLGLSVLIAVAAIGTAAAASRTPADSLAKLTAGRVAGTPQDCITLRDIRSSTIIDRTAIVYELNNGTRYVNTPTSGATFLDPDLTLITDTHSPQLCSIDSVRLYDTSLRMHAGSVGLGQFVPYPRPAKAAKPG